MKILSIEPTPSPNVMKLTIDETLPPGKSKNYTKGQKDQASEWIVQILDIDGVKGIFQVSDFIAVERNSNADWKDLLTSIRLVFGDSSDELAKTELTPSASFGEIQVLIQTFKGIPIQVKLLSGTEEKRFGLPDRFRDAVMKVQVASKNYILERKWEEQGARYGSFQEIGDEVVQELAAAYDQERIEKLVEEALHHADEVEVTGKQEPEMTSEQVASVMNDPNWEKRFAALERMNPTLEDIPILVKALQDSKQSIRRLATVYLGMIGKPEVLPHLFRALQDSSVSVRRTAGDALSDIGDPAAIPAMIEALQDKNKLVRWRAARFLFEVGDERAVPALDKAQHDPEFEVSLQAKMALERIERGEEASGTIWQQMTRDLGKQE